jgi:sugar phosphate isomerase/epimerase
MNPSLPRRDFLLAAAGLGMAIGAPGLAAGPRKSLLLGFGLYGAKGAKLEDFLPKLASLGYDAVELCLTPGWGYEPPSCSRQRRGQIAALLGKTGLVLSSLMEHVDLGGDAAAQKAVCERLARAAEMGHQLSPHSPPVIETTLGGGKWEQVRTQFRDNLGGWAAVAERGKTVIALKPHRMNAVSRPEHALWLLQQVPSPWIKLVYDFSHYVHSDLTLEGTLAALLPHTAFVHVKDAVMDKGRAQFRLAGESGQIPYGTLFRKLREGGYRGCVCCEVSGMISSQPGYNPLHAATRCYQNMSQAMREST